MQKIVFTILSNKNIAADTYRLELKSDFELDIHCGQFVDIAIEGKYLRRPFAVCDTNGQNIIIIYKVAGEGTLRLSTMSVGQVLDILVPCGNAYNIEICPLKALLISGGLGAAPLFFVAKELLNAGKEVNIILGFNTAADIVLLEEYKALGLEPLVVTLDGSYGSNGLVTEYINNYDYDYFYTCGPIAMMKAVCKIASTSGECSLEERMGCGVGICYGCTCNTLVGPKRICKDGPVFKKEDILW